MGFHAKGPNESEAVFVQEFHVIMLALFNGPPKCALLQDIYYEESGGRVIFDQGFLLLSYCACLEGGVKAQSKGGTKYYAAKDITDMPLIGDGEQKERRWALLTNKAGEKEQSAEAPTVPAEKFREHLC
ncbi:hypothetical protein DdX_06162 [Ditylenchus destructor]|uniref:Uncharacterized protein n=1 Tax=Ditylenchus destructor TaxID=166010 RepID=A0AAD4N6R0_9BILA|nr:hypothetical protein DdX_06162 [Ditylenchus destructor]